MSARLPIFLIAGVGRRGQLGLNGQIPWHDPHDLAWFKNMTSGADVLFGPATVAAAPHLMTLPSRRIHIDDRERDPLELYNHLVGGTLKPLWIAGGAKTYARWMQVISRFYVSKIDYDGPADVWMPPLWNPPPVFKPWQGGYGLTLDGMLELASHAITVKGN